MKAVDGAEMVEEWVAAVEMKAVDGVREVFEVIAAVREAAFHLECIAAEAEERICREDD